MGEAVTEGGLGTILEAEEEGSSGADSSIGEAGLRSVEHFNIGEDLD